MAGMLEYKCPCCDGAIQFDSATQKMKCPYCDTEFDVDTLKGYDEELKDEKPSEMEWTTPGGSWAEGETASLHTYSCKSCGGEIVGDDTMAASACPFCGNPIVLTGQFAGALRPDLIIPFKLDKKAAKAKLQEKYAQSAKRLQDQNAAYTKFCADNDLKPYHERLAVAGWDRSAASTASAAVRGGQNKTVENFENGGMIKSIRIDDIKSAISGATVKEEVAAKIYDVLNDHDALRLYDNAVVKNLGQGIVFQTDVQKAGTFFKVVFVINEDVVGGKTVDEINIMFESAWNTVANDFDDAVIHEMYHSKLIQGLNYSQLENLYDELDYTHINGLSKTAYIDGAECIAETGVLIERGEKEKVPKEALALFERFFGET